MTQQMCKRLFILVLLFLTGCIVRTTKTYSHIPSNSRGILVDEKEETIWIWDWQKYNNPLK